MAELLGLHQSSCKMSVLWQTATEHVRGFPGVTDCGIRCNKLYGRLVLTFQVKALLCYLQVHLAWGSACL